MRTHAAPSFETRTLRRHARPCAGHPRLAASRKDVDGRAKPGHDDLGAWRVPRPVAEPRLSPLFTCQTAHLVPAAQFLHPGFCILAAPSPDRGVAERRETFGCNGTRWACAH